MGGTCSTVAVVSGDSCFSLAGKCGISPADFTTYNPSSTLCSTLQPGQIVCCSAGILPDLTPKPNADGSCATYVVVPGDFCALIASRNGLTVDKLEIYNKNTWGWTGCANLQAGVKMCLSTGTEPFPAPLPNTVCGPQVPGTVRSPFGEPLAIHNPCPLNACCDIWGQCGTTAEFCTISQSVSGAPGTAAKGENGCISNCGTGLVTSSPPALFRRVAYFEGFNGNRKCLHMDVNDVDTSKYTHIHFAFAGITHDYQVDVSSVQSQFDQFVGLTDVKRILSFGGWAFSTSQDTYAIFGESVTTENRDKFITNLVAFAEKYNLDGLDFDWEYPSQTDINGIPPASVDDGWRYYWFLAVLRSKLSPSRSISIAAPASYWYLRGFPISSIGSIVDYIIYMTYDLHGQWDYENKWSSSGCPLGNCLRSHVNGTETGNALSMITKAGVPSNKVVVGVSSYGRSFRMTTPGCTGPMCTYTGKESGATKGRCTDTAGYISNAEIMEIIKAGGNIKTYYDEISASNVLVYNNLDWVSYMDDENKDQRTALFQYSNFGGITDWAVDLQTFGDGDEDDDDEELGDNQPPCDYSLSFNSLEDLGNVADQYSIYCSEIYTVKTLSGELSGALARYTNIDNGYDSLFDYYVDYMEDMISATLLKFMNTVNGPGNKYFDCLYKSGGGSETVQCPISQVLFDGVYTLTYILRDRTGFFSDLLQNYGIIESWVKFGEEHFNNACPGSGGGIKDPDTQCHITRGTWKGYPQRADTIKVDNPKEFIINSLENIHGLQNNIDVTAKEQASSTFFSSSDDAVDALAMPVAMVKQAVASMEEVKKIGKTEKANQKKALIINILTAVLVLLPFVGEAAAVAAGAAKIAQVILILGEAANAGLALYDISENPLNSPLALLGILLGPAGAARSPESFVNRAALTRQIGAKDASLLGDVVGKQSKLIQKITRRSCTA